MEIQMSPSENEIMRVIWQSDGKITVAPLLDKLSVVGKQWKSNTVVTFLSRLVNKGLLCIEKNGRNNTYIAVLSEAEFKKQQTKALLNEAYGGNVEEFVASLLEHNNLPLRDIDMSSVVAGKKIVQQILNDESRKKERVTYDDIGKELRTELASRKASINTKRKNIIQLEWEIKEDEQRVNELNTLLNKLNTIDEIEKSGGILI